MTCFCFRVKATRDSLCFSPQKRRSLSKRRATIVSSVAASWRGGYRAHLKTTVAFSAAPYGYTLTIWTAGAVTTHEHGVPSAWEVLLLMIGAVLGFALAAAMAQRQAPGGPFKRSRSLHGTGSGVVSTSVPRCARLGWRQLRLPRSASPSSGQSSASSPLVAHPVVTAGQFALADVARRQFSVRTTEGVTSALRAKQKRESGIPSLNPRMPDRRSLPLSLSSRWALVASARS